MRQERRFLFKRPGRDSNPRPSPFLREMHADNRAYEFILLLPSSLGGRYSIQTELPGL